MKQQQSEPMNNSWQFCPNERCLARGKVGEGKCTFSARRGTMLEGLRKPTELIVVVVTLLAMDVLSKQLFMPMIWMNERLRGDETVQEAIVSRFIMPSSNKETWTSCMCKRMKSEPEAGDDCMDGLSDEGFNATVVGRVVSRARDTILADHLMREVCACWRTACAVLICTDGWATYPNSICRAFRDKVKETAGKGDVACACGLTCVSPRLSNERRRNGSSEP